MRNRSFTSSFRKSLLLGGLLLAAAQTTLYRLDLPSPEFFGGFQGVGRKCLDVERFAGRGPIDVIVVGDSRIAVGLDARKLEALTGLRTYNCGLFGTNLHSQSLLVRDYLVPRYRPRFLLWHVSLQVASRADVNRRISGSHAFALLRFPHGHRLLRLANSFFPYQKRPIEGWAETIVNRQRRELDDRESPQAAEWQFPLKRKRGGAAAPRMNAGGEECGADAWTVFRAALDSARRRGMRIVACTAPYHSNVYRDSFAGSGADGSDFFVNADKFQSLIDEYDIPYVNYRYFAPISQQKTLFLDESHLNGLGAEILTDRIATPSVPR